jgi:hypothetical protein
MTARRLFITPHAPQPPRSLSSALPPSCSPSPTPSSSLPPTMLEALPAALYLLLAPLLWVAPPPSAPVPAPVPAQPLRFSLRHEHALTPSGRTVFRDAAPAFVGTSYDVGTAPTRAHRPSSAAAFHAARGARRRAAAGLAPALADVDAAAGLLWDEAEVPGPYVSSRAALLALAQMSNNAYYAPDEKGWYDLGGNWTVVRVLRAALSRRRER